MTILDAAGSLSDKQDLSTTAAGTTVLSTNWIDMLGNESPAGVSFSPPAWRDWGAGNPFYIVFTITTAFAPTLGVISPLQLRCLAFADSTATPVRGVNAIDVGTGDLITLNSTAASPGFRNFQNGRFAMAINPLAGGVNNNFQVGHRYLRVGYEFTTSAGADTLASGAISAQLSMTPDIAGGPSPATGLGGQALVPNVYPASVVR